MFNVGTVRNSKAFLNTFEIQDATTTELTNKVYRLKPKKLQTSSERKVHAVLVLFKVELKRV